MEVGNSIANFTYIPLENTKLTDVPNLHFEFGSGNNQKLPEKSIQVNLSNFVISQLDFSKARAPYFPLVIQLVKKSLT